MAQNSLAVKIVSGALKNGGRCSRSLHESVASKKGLHNTDSVVGMVADSLGRSRVKLTASDVERNGMLRVGPTSDMLHQMPKLGMETVANTTVSEPPIEQKSGFVMTDPNSSMWNLCKGNKETESATKKLTKKFIKMKDNIKQYYMDRLEENQVMFTEIEEPLRIGKLDKKDRSFRHKEVRDEELEPLDDVQAMQGQRSKKHKASLFSQLQNDKPEMEMEGKNAQEEVVYTEPQVKGYKKFNKLEYKKSGERDEATEREFEARAVRMPKGEDRMYVEQERTLIPSMWKRPQIKDKEVKDNRGDGGFTDVSGGMSPAVHFKHQLGLRNKGLLDSIRSGNLVQGFYRKRLNGSRYYSTHMKDGGIGKVGAPKLGAPAFEHYKPLPLVLQREIVTNLRNKSVDNKLISAHSLSTCSKYYAQEDPCRPPALPPQDVPCDPKVKLPKCPKLTEEEKKPCCPRITLCGCDPPHPRAILGTCSQNDLKPFLTMAKRPEYMCPSFSECFRRPEMTAGRKAKAECCYTNKNLCDTFVGIKKSSVTALERQEINLGQKYWTSQQQQAAQYHMSARRFKPLVFEKVMTYLNQSNWNCQQTAKFHRSSINFTGAAAEEECEGKSGGKGQLPCLKPSGKGKKKGYQGKGSCEKLCMPCCEPARDPPDCSQSAFERPPCTKFRNPRPSFSECKKKFPWKHSMCECEVPKKPRCDEKKKQESTC